MTKICLALPGDNKALAATQPERLAALVKGPL
jgi:hypothetical protein